MEKDYNKMTREELVEEIRHQRRYSSLLLNAVRNYALNLLAEVKTLRHQYETEAKEDDEVQEHVR